MLDKKAAREIALQYSKVVSDALKPKSVIFFGSYLNGTPHEFSDIDIAVVLDGHEEDWLDTAILLQTLCGDIDEDMNNYNYIEPHLMDETSDASGFLEYIKKHGEIIYEA